MEVLFFNLSLNLRSPRVRVGSELPPSLTSKTPNHYSPCRAGSGLADLRSTALLQSSLPLTSLFSITLESFTAHPVVPPERMLQPNSQALTVVLAGFTVMNAAQKLYFCYTLDAVSY